MKKQQSDLLCPWLNCPKIPVLTKRLVNRSYLLRTHVVLLRLNKRKARRKASFPLPMWVCILTA